jgi:hypothetical protein
LREIVEPACAELELHATLEEELFYPALREAVDEEDQEMMEEARIEHDTAKQLIAQLRDLEPGEPAYAASFTVLSEYVKHHVQEEESEIFKAAKRAKLDLKELGDTFEQRRGQLQGSAQDSMREDGGKGEDRAGQGPREIRVKEMDVEDEADMEPARPHAGRGARGAR